MPPIKENIKKIDKEIKKNAPKRPVQQKKKRKHKEYGTSKLEERFAHNFLEKLKIEYIYQYKMESIGRYLDFFLPEYRVAIEVDGDYWHSKGLIYEEMNPTQKHNKRVDEQKNHWCKINGIPLIRIWEDDINNHPESVLKMLKERLSLEKKEKDIKDNKKKRH